MQREPRPEKGVVAREKLAKEDGGHGTCLGVRGALEEVSEFESEGIGILLLTEVEEQFGFRSLLVGGGHEVRD